ncbi:hypothetical protein M218_04970 [Burkholderia pseudomallei MSHR338]|uniref:Uncharacterized protein n=2 Tax=Burkholderia pseudomallei TaxID=28450 RepID=Q3JV04_BURP1|nr:hypothetical protein BURPS1710b_1188 [Burkholderia pseudomallei 1710b]ACQ95784.1 conserved hypothetical protein [Burkholderia pseudomallei MSHR346]EDO94170.1 conserved hypothetical protein [Burkholderia pseudomallei Pasteur 52237]EET09581.1 conserved hypothetical protein [Burkholderia pseudomallei 1710a]EQA90114.1 hypothetical protein M218_04970 [Burkholderia pseudomallei MSHR338]
MPAPRASDLTRPPARGRARRAGDAAGDAAGRQRCCQPSVT